MSFKIGIKLSISTGESCPLSHVEVLLESSWPQDDNMMALVCFGISRPFEAKNGLNLLQALTTLFTAFTCVSYCFFQ